MSQRSLIRTTLLLIGSLACGAADSAQAREVIHDSAIALEPIPGSQTAFLTLHLDEETSPVELSNDVELFRKGGQKAVIARWQKQQPVVGRLLEAGKLGRDLRVAHTESLADGGRRITLFYDREITLSEMRHMSRTREYPVTWIELEIGADGRGQGKLVPVGRLKLVDGHLAIDRWGIQDVRLNDVRIEAAN